MKKNLLVNSGMVALVAGSVAGIAAPMASAAANPYAKHVTISIADPGNGGTIKMVASDPLLQYMEKKFNITIKLVTETWSNYDQQTSLWAASGQLPDVWFSDQLNNSTYDQWIAQGLVASIPSDLRQYPYLNKLMNESDVKPFAVGGKMYFIPRQLQQQNVLPSDFGIVVRKDWMQKLHLSQPRTWKDFVHILQEFVKNNPAHQKNVVGLTTNNEGWLINDLFTNAFPQHNWWYKNSSGKWIPAIASPKYLDLINQLHQLYSTGLLDKDWANVNNQPMQKFVNGQAGAMDQQPKNLYVLEQAWDAAHPKEPFNKYVEFLMMPPGPDGNRYQYVYYNWWSENMINANVDSTKMDRILALFNYLISPQGRIVSKFGIEGKDWKMVGGKIKSLDPASWNIGTTYPSEGLFGAMAISGNARREGLPEFKTVNPVPTGWTKMSYDMLQTYINQYMNITKPTAINWTVNAYASGLPPITVGTDQNDAVAQAVAAKDPGIVWKSFLQTQYKNGLTREIQEVNTKYKNAKN